MGSALCSHRIFCGRKHPQNRLPCNENPIYVFVFWDLRSLSPNCHIHVSVSELYNPRIGPNIFLYQNRQIKSREYVNCSQTHECGNWDCGRAILCWEYLFRIFGTGLCSVPQSGESGEALEVSHQVLLFRLKELPENRHA